MIRGLLAFFVGLALSGVAAPAAASGLDDVAFLEGHWSGDDGLDVTVTGIDGVLHYSRRD